MTQNNYNYPKTIRNNNGSMQMIFPSLIQRTWGRTTIDVNVAYNFEKGKLKEIVITQVKQK